MTNQPTTNGKGKLAPRKNLSSGVTNDATGLTGTSHGKEMMEKVREIFPRLMYTENDENLGENQIEFLQNFCEQQQKRIDDRTKQRDDLAATGLEIMEQRDQARKDAAIMQEALKDHKENGWDDLGIQECPIPECKLCKALSQLSQDYTND